MDLFVNFYDTVHPLLEKVMLLLVSFIKRPHQSLAGIGVAAFVRLISSAGEFFTDDEWLEVVMSLKEAANATLPYISFVHSEDGLSYEEVSTGQSNGAHDDNLENLQKNRLHASISDAKCHAAVQLSLIQAITEIYNMHRSSKNTTVLFDAVHGVASHAHKINIDVTLRSKLQDLQPMTQMQDPPLLRLENESYQICLKFVQNLALDRPPFYEESKVESCLVALCQEVLQFYVELALPENTNELSHGVQPRWLIPLGSGKKRELVARAPLIVVTLQAMCSSGDSSFEKHLASYFHLLSSLIGVSTVPVMFKWLSVKCLALPWDLFCSAHVDTVSSNHL